jgi:hypothetical protein
MAPPATAVATSSASASGANTTTTAEAQSSRPPNRRGRSLLSQAFKPAMRTGQDRDGVREEGDPPISSGSGSDSGLTNTRRNRAKGRKKKIGEWTCPLSPDIVLVVAELLGTEDLLNWSLTVSPLYFLIFLSELIFFCPSFLHSHSLLPIGSLTLTPHTHTVPSPLYPSFSPPLQHPPP